MPTDPATPAKQPVPDWLKCAIALLAVLAYIAAAAAVLLGFATGSIKDAVVGVVVGGVLATLAAEYKGIMGYVFGGSAASDRKTELLNQAPAAPAVLLATAPDAERLDDMIRRLAALAPGPDADKLAADIAALRAKIAAAPKS